MSASRFPIITAVCPNHGEQGFIYDPICCWATCPAATPCQSVIPDEHGRVVQANTYLDAERRTGVGRG